MKAIIELWRIGQVAGTSPTTTFKLLAATTVTRFVAFRFYHVHAGGASANLRMHHDVGGLTTMADQLSHLVNPRTGMVEKAGIGLTEVVMAKPAILVLVKTVLGAAAIAGFLVITAAAFIRQRLKFVLAESLLSFRVHQRFNRRLIGIAQFVFRINIVVTGVDIAIVLHYYPATTVFRIDTEAGRLA